LHSNDPATCSKTQLLMAKLSYHSSLV